jgi:formylglycine-generating enzyme required for sulfatase activity
MGCNSGELDGTCGVDEQPRHTVTLSAYCIERNEVRVGAYRACIDAGVCTGAPTTTGSDNWCNWSTGVGSREDHPINCINWSESQEFCQAWMGGDLPTEAQWEKAARGPFPDQRKYPWGNSPEPDCNYCNFDVNGGASGEGCSSVTNGPGTWQVGYLTSGAGDSPYGIAGMAGNVCSWVLDRYDANFYNNCTSGCTDPENASSGTDYVLRGGSYNVDSATNIRVVARHPTDPTLRLSKSGILCRRTP